MIKVLLVVFAAFFLFYLALFAFSAIKRRSGKKRAVLTGGGSSGHIYPAIAIGKALYPEVEKFLYIGSRGRIEEKVVPKENLPLKLIYAAPYPSRKILLPFFFLKLFIGMVQSAYHLFFFNPDYLIGTGGFVSAPVVFSAFILKKIGLLKTKICLHEQNVTPGKLNLLASKIADVVMATFPQSLHFFGDKGALIGYPVRIFDKKGSKEEIFKKLKIPSQRKVIFAFGGSQGSRTINRCVVSSLKYLLPYKDKIFIILSCGLGQSDYNGKKDVEEQLEKIFKANELAQIKEFFIYEPYFFNVDEILSVADFAVARSGAGTLFELASFQLPSILIPKLGLSNEHQFMNAMAMEDAGGAAILFEKPSFENFSVLSVDGKTLAEKITEIIFSEDKLAQMKEGTKKFISCPDTLNSIKKIILQGEKPKEECLSSSPFFKIKPPSVLLSYLQKLKEKDKERFDISSYFKESEINFYNSITLKLLSSSEWKQKNIGVKLAAFFKTDETKKMLLEIITSREKAPFLYRIFGENIKNVGFVRRNSFLSLREYDLNSEELKSILKIGFSDPYYECKTAALLLAQIKSKDIENDKDFISLAKDLSNNKSFEVAKEAVILLGKIGAEEEAYFLLSFKDHFFWQVRESALIAIRTILERGAKVEKDKIINEILKFNLTATDYKPIFTIKQNCKKIFDLLEKN